MKHEDDLRFVYKSHLCSWQQIAVAAASAMIQKAIAGKSDSPQTAEQPQPPSQTVASGESTEHRRDRIRRAQENETDSKIAFGLNTRKPSLSSKPVTEPDKGLV